MSWKSGVIMIFEQYENQYKNQFFASFRPTEKYPRKQPSDKWEKNFGAQTALFTWHPWPTKLRQEITRIDKNYHHKSIRRQLAEMSVEMGGFFWKFNPNLVLYSHSLQGIYNATIKLEFLDLSQVDPQKYLCPWPVYHWRSDNSIRRWTNL